LMWRFLMIYLDEKTKARSSGVERLLDTQEVGGSKPPAPTIL
jgi:hypothetical protein